MILNREQNKKQKWKFYLKRWAESWVIELKEYLYYRKQDINYNTRTEQQSSYEEDILELKSKSNFTTLKDNGGLMK